MKIDRIELHPDGSSDFKTLSFRDPTKQNPYNVKSIAGLDADNIVSRYYGVSANSAAAFYNLSLENREIVMKIGLNPDFAQGKSYSDLRDDIYKIVSASRTGLLNLWFRNSTPAGVIFNVAIISGFVTKIEAPQFEKTQEVQITISCTEPFLRGYPTSVPVAGLDPELTTIQDNISTAPHGFEFVAVFSGFLASFHIESQDASWSFEVNPVGGFGAGDELHFSSEPKDKQLYIQRGATQILLADVIWPLSIWPIIFPGANIFVCENPTLITWQSITYVPAYWGV